jgi:hypothetical protein
MIFTVFPDLLPFFVLLPFSGDLPGKFSIRYISSVRINRQENAYQNAQFRGGSLKIKLPAFLFFLPCVPSFQYWNLPFGDPCLYLGQVKADQPPNLHEGNFPFNHIFPQGRLFYGCTLFQFRNINQMFHRSLRTQD